MEESRRLEYQRMVADDMDDANNREGEEGLLNSSRLLALIALFFMFILFMFWTDNPQQELLCLAGFVFLSVTFIFCCSILPGMFRQEVVEGEGEGREEQDGESEREEGEREFLLAQPLPSYQSLFFSEKPPSFDEI